MGFIEADDAMKALKQVVKDYKHPCGLYSAVINLATPANPMVARYLSSKAATSEDTECGLHHYERGVLYVNGKVAKVNPERYEVVNLKSFN